MYLSEYQYYTNEANYGSYQYVSLDDIVANFIVMYSGNHSLINNESRYKVLFHAKRAIQELNYDAFKEVKVLELDLCDSLRYVLPSDYVNWVRISLLKDGELRPITENTSVMTAKAYLQDNNCNILFDENGEVLKPELSNLDVSRLSAEKKEYSKPGSSFDGCMGYHIDGVWYFDFVVATFTGEHPTFSIDKKAGVINFDSNAAGETIILEYISDGMEGGDTSKMSVNKLFEKYVYAYISYEILSNKLGVQEYIVARARKEKAALLRNAKIRISNIHPGRLLKNLRMRGQWTK